MPVFPVNSHDHIWPVCPDPPEASRQYYFLYTDRTEEKHAPKLIQDA